MLAALRKVLFLSDIFPTGWQAAESCAIIRVVLRPDGVVH